MTKPNSLQAVLDRASAEKSVAPPKRGQKAPTQKEAPDNASPEEPPTPATTPGRRGTKMIGGHFPPEVSTQLRLLAAEEDTTIQSLLAEALDDLFVKKGRSRMAKRSLGGV